MSNVLYYLSIFYSKIKSKEKQIKVIQNWKKSSIKTLSLDFSLIEFLVCVSFTFSQCLWHKSSRKGKIKVSTAECHCKRKRIQRRRECVCVCVCVCVNVCVGEENRILSSAHTLCRGRMERRNIYLFQPGQTRQTDGINVLFGFPGLFPPYPNGGLFAAPLGRDLQRKTGGLCALY